MQIVNLNIADIRPYERNARKNDQAVDAVAQSIRQCEYVAPIVIDENNVILAGHTRWKALKKLGVTDVECVRKCGLTDDQKRKYRLLDNKTAELAEWDFELLSQELDDLDFGDLDIDWGIYKEKSNEDIIEDEAPEVDVKNKSNIELGDVYRLGRHRLMCGDSTKNKDVETLMGGGTSRFITDGSSV